MRIFNENKTIELKQNEVDLTKGYLKDDKLFVVHHEAQEEIAQQSHYETIATYPNGGKDVKEVIDVPYSPAKEAWDEYEDIKVYVEYTQSELEELKQKKYELKVESLIRKRYTFTQELATLRQRDTKPDEYKTYNDYCEECKAIAKAEVQ